MDRNFTLKPFNYFKIAMLAAVFVIGSAFMQPDLARVSGTNTGVQSKTIKCYPNPAISFVNFEFPADYASKGYQIQVYSFTGKKMYEAAINSAKSTLTFTSDFYRGIYIYQMQDKSGKILETGKFQVNR